MDEQDGGQVAPILRSGYLVKRGQARKNWNRRWFLFRSDGSLTYYVSEQKPCYLGGMDVSNCVVQSCPDKSGHPFCFVVANERRQLFLSAANEKEKEEWLCELSTMAMPGLLEHKISARRDKPFSRKFSGCSSVSRLPSRRTTKESKPCPENWSQSTLPDWGVNNNNNNNNNTPTSKSGGLMRRVTVVEHRDQPKENQAAAKSPKARGERENRVSPLKLRPFRNKPPVSMSEPVELNRSVDWKPEKKKQVSSEDKVTGRRVDRKMSFGLGEVRKSRSRSDSYDDMNNSKSLPKRERRFENGAAQRSSPKIPSPSPSTSSPRPAASQCSFESPTSSSFLSSSVNSVSCKAPYSSPMIQYSKRTSPLQGPPTGNSSCPEPSAMLRSLDPSDRERFFTLTNHSSSSSSSRTRSQLERSASIDSLNDHSRDGEAKTIRKSLSTPRLDSVLRLNTDDEKVASPSKSPTQRQKESPKGRNPFLKRIATNPKKKRPLGVAGSPESSSLLSEGPNMTSSSVSPSSPFRNTSPAYSPPHPESPVVAGSFQGSDEIFEGYVRSNPREIRKSGYAVYAPVWESDSVPFSMNQTLVDHKGKSAPQKIENFSDRRRRRVRQKSIDEKPIVDGFLCERKGDKRLHRRWYILLPSGAFLCFRNQQAYRSKTQPEFSLSLSTECTMQLESDSPPSFSILSRGDRFIFEALSTLDCAEWLASFEKVQKTIKTTPSCPVAPLSSSGTTPTPSKNNENPNFVLKRTPSHNDLQGEGSLEVFGSLEEERGGRGAEEESHILSVSVLPASENDEDDVRNGIFDRLKDCSTCPVDEVKEYLESEGVEVLNRLVKGRQTFLHAAIERDSLDLVGYLVKRGVSLRIIDQEGSSPLHFCKSVACLKLLLEADPQHDINVVDENGTTAFAHLLTIRDMDEETFVMLVEQYGAEIHRRNIRLESPLHFAARFGSERVVELLLESRSNPNSQNDKGMTPLHYAVMAHREIIASCLVAHGADPFIQAHDGQSARECGVMSEIWDSGEAKTGFSLLVGQPLICLLKLLKNENEEYMKVFCLTYHTFTSDEKILEFIKEELNVERPTGMEDQEFFAGLLNPMRVSVVRLVLWWVRIRFFDLRFPMASSVVRELMNIVDELCRSISEQAGGITIEQIATLSGTTMDDSSPIPKDHPLRMNLREVYDKAIFVRSPRSLRSATLSSTKPNRSFSNWMKGIRGRKKDNDDDTDDPVSMSYIPPKNVEDEEKDNETTAFTDSAPSPTQSPPPSPIFPEDSPAQELPSSEEFNVIVQDASLIIISQLVGTLKEILRKWCFQSPSQTLKSYERFLAHSPVRSLDLRAMKSAKIARYLTLLHFELIHAIHPSELLDPKWTETPEGFSNLRRYVDHFNTLSRWVAWTIIDPLLSKDRALMLTKWVHVADECRVIKNYCALVSILGGLLSSPVHRMKRTFAGVSKATLATFSQLKQVMDPRGSSSAYRKLLSAAEAPCVPYLGIIMQDITFISDGNPDYVGNKEEEQVNFSKRKQIYNAILPILKFQHQGFEFGSGGTSPRCMSEEDTLRRGQIPFESLYFLSLERHTEKELDSLSLEREPRE